MARRKKEKPEETLVDIVQARDQAQDYFERNQLKVLGILGIVILIAGGLFLFSNLYQKPRNQRAMDQMFQAQFQFERDSFVLALNNPGGGYDGFLDIIDNYNGTKASNLAHYYAGVSYLHLGRYEAAIDYFEDFKPAGDLTPIMRFGALGDAYSELGNFDKALEMYGKAGAKDKNALLSPYYLLKLGMLQEQQGNKAAALKAYQQIKIDYPESVAARDIDKYIAKASGS